MDIGRERALPRSRERERERKEGSADELKKIYVDALKCCSLERQKIFKWVRRISGGLLLKLRSVWKRMKDYWAAAFVAAGFRIDWNCGCCCSERFTDNHDFCEAQ